jgi:hypothetical protein
VKTGPWNVDGGLIEVDREMRKWLGGNVNWMGSCYEGVERARRKNKLICSKFILRGRAKEARARNWGV